MKNKSTKVDKESRAKNYEALERLVRGNVRGFIQDSFEEEGVRPRSRRSDLRVNEFLGRAKSERIDVPLGYRNGYGKPRRLSRYLLFWEISVDGLPKKGYPKNCFPLLYLLLCPAGIRYNRGG
jgi:hypothetical protein